MPLLMNQMGPMGVQLVLGQALQAAVQASATAGS